MAAIPSSPLGHTPDTLAIPAAPIAKTTTAAVPVQRYQRLSIDDQGQRSIHTCQTKAFQNLDKSQLESAEHELEGKVKGSNRTVQVLTMLI